MHSGDAVKRVSSTSHSLTVGEYVGGGDSGQHSQCAMSSSTAKFSNMKHAQYAEEQYACQEIAVEFPLLWLDTEVYCYVI